LEYALVNHPHAVDETIPLRGVLLLILVSALWGGNMVSIKVSNQGIPPILAATARSVLAAALIWAYARAWGERVFVPRQDLHHAVAIGVLFGLDFLFLYWGAAFTSASRAIIFLYSHPLWVALGAHFLLPDDRLTWTKGTGLVLAFCGLVSVFGSRSASLGSIYWLGDLMEVFAAVFWAATTIYLKKFVRERPITHFQTLFAQLFFSIPLLAVAYLILEWNRPVMITLPVLSAFAYQTLLVAFFSYLLWFWMIHHYPVSRLAAFTFLAPLLGVIFSGVLLGEPLTVMLLAGLMLVAVGIYLVNRPEKAVSEG
jgi:drug/metabolite transporter (DMT)-like permease